MTTLPTPYYDDGQIAIYNSDCRDVLPLLEPSAADLVLSDPPYGIDFDYGDEHTDDADAYGSFISHVVKLARPLIKPSGIGAFYQSATTAWQWANWFPEGWRMISLPKRFVQMRPSIVQAATDYVVWWQEEPRGLGNTRDWQPQRNFDWYVSSANPSNRPKGHPCPRPLDGTVYVASILCPRGGLVVDPFLGSGTTAVAARSLGQRCIGIERSERYCQAAVKRLQQSVMQFDEPATRATLCMEVAS